MYYYGFDRDRRCVFNADGPIQDVEGITIIPSPVFYSDISKIYLKLDPVGGFTIALREPNKEDLVREALEFKLSELRKVSYHLSILCDVIDLSTDTEAVANAKVKEAAYRAYRVAIYNIDPNTAPDIEWPTAPMEG